MATQRKYILLALSTCSLFLIVYGFSRAPSAPVTIVPFVKPERGDRQVTFVITNSLPKDLTWISIVEVGGPDNWYPAAKQPKATQVNKIGLRTLSAHSAYWLLVSVPEEGGTWRLRCMMERPQTALEKRFTAIYDKLRMDRWSWSVTSPSVTPDANHAREPGHRALVAIDALRGRRR